jgi:hypothetical protein
MVALTNETCEIDFRQEKRKQARDLRRRSGQELQEQKDELASRIDELIQKVSDFRIRLEVARVAIQQSVGHQVPGHDEGKGVLGTEMSQMLKRLTDEQATVVRPEAWAPAGSDGQGREEAATRWRENEGLEDAGADGARPGQIEGVSMNLSETEENVEPWVGVLEQVALGLAETKNWTSRVESGVAGLRTAMADASAKVEEVQ